MPFKSLDKDMIGKAFRNKYKKTYNDWVFSQMKEKPRLLSPPPLAQGLIFVTAHLRHTYGTVLHKHSRSYQIGNQQDNHQTGTDGYVFFFLLVQRQFG